MFKYSIYSKLISRNIYKAVFEFETEKEIDQQRKFGKNNGEGEPLAMLAGPKAPKLKSELQVFLCH